MTDMIHLYISAAPDLDREREVLGRAVTEIPVTLGWRIFQSPVHGETVDLNAVATANVHLLLLGSDIRAPIGLEWLTARRAGKRPAPFLKRDRLRTPAAQAFIRHIEEANAWHPFVDSADLRAQALELLADHILNQAAVYVLSPDEIARLMSWKEELKGSKVEIQDLHGGAGEGGVILSPDRFNPRGGVLIQPGKRSEEDA